MATKLEGGGCKTLLAGPLKRKIFFSGFPYLVEMHRLSHILYKVTQSCNISLEVLEGVHNLEDGHRTAGVELDTILLSLRIQLDIYQTQSFILVFTIHSSYVLVHVLG